MGMTPQQIQAMTLFEYTSCIEGFEAAHKTKDDEDSDDDMTPELLRSIMNAPPFNRPPKPAVN